MGRTLALVAVLSMAGCPPTPTPVPDAGPPPPPAQDSAPPPPPDACAQACSAMQAAGCPQMTTCAQALADVQGKRLARNPKTGLSLSCGDLLQVKSPADVRATGWNCSDAGR